MVNTKNKWMIYGASGYTGELIARQCKESHFHPILAGRNEEKIRQLATELGLEYRIFDLDQASNLENNLTDIEILLNTAGPFVKTAKAIVNVCLKTGTHYLDITGEIAVFEELHLLSGQAKEKNIIILPGVGFDVVPTDCLARELKDLLPDAQSLELAFYSHGGQFSRGTLRTALLSLGQGTYIRKNKQLHKIKDFSDKIHLPHPYDPKKKLEMYAVSWGDVSTAFYSTQIPNIKVYTHIPKIVADFILKPLLPPLSLLFKNKKSTDFILNLIPIGPDSKKRENAKMWIWGKVSCGAKKIEKSLEVMEGYNFTVKSALWAVQKILELKENHQLKGGFYTPSLLFGSQMMREIK